MGVKALFKVDVKSCPADVNLGPFSIMTMTSDAQLIAQYCNFNTIANVNVQDREDAESVASPVRPVIVRSVPNVVRVGVKRNLMEAFSGNEGEDEKFPKVEGE